MNQPDRIDDRDDDAALEKLLSPLKRIEPPAATKETFRALVAAELADAVPIRARAPWWRRSIQVPVPAALLVTLLLLISVAWALRAPQAREPQATLPVPSPAAVSSPEAVARAASSPQSPEPEYYSAEIYVCGVGRISSVSGYTIQEENHVP